MTPMRVEHGDQRGALLHDADPRMGMTVNAAFVPFGHTKGAFEIEVVDGKVGIVAAGEESGSKGTHRFPEVTQQRVGGLCVSRGERVETSTTSRGGSLFGLQQGPDACGLRGVP